MCEPQRKQIRFGLVTLSTAVNLPDVAKPEMRVEVMSAGTRAAVRGGWERRAQTERSRNLGDPAEHNGRDEYISPVRLRLEVGHAHSSEEAANHRGAKGRDCERVSFKEGTAA